ncbi:MAG: hypothetical protein U5K76_11155 [Woeseiaceae bacterium]|nr:hypothetical protein [Woeseiaceae bacterium]
MTEQDKTVRLHARRPRVTTDERGHSVWSETIRTATFELVSTARLRKLLDDDDEQQREEVRRLAETQGNGYLARDHATGMFRIIDDADLQALLDSEDAPAPVARPADVTSEPAKNTDDEDLSLVSTQALRKILELPEDRAASDDAPARDEGGGFDPYNNR